MVEDEHKIILPLNVSIIVSQNQNRPCLELRRQITDQELIKAIITASFYEKPILIQPTFRDKLKSIASLVEKGILYYDNTLERFVFTI